VPFLPGRIYGVRTSIEAVAKPSGWIHMDLGLMIMEILLTHRKSSFAVLAALFLSAFGIANAADVSKSAEDNYREIDSRLVKELPG
jgi:hypothetical protein